MVAPYHVVPLRGKETPLGDLNTYISFTLVPNNWIKGKNQSIYPQFIEIVWVRDSIPRDEPLGINLKNVPSPTVCVLLFLQV